MYTKINDWSKKKANLAKSPIVLQSIKDQDMSYSRNKLFKRSSDGLGRIKISILLAFGLVIKFFRINWM